MSKRKGSFFDIVPSAERQLHSVVIAWVQCKQVDTEYCLLQKLDPHDRWQFVVAKYRNSYDSFNDRRSFHDLTEAWKFFVDASEMYCFTPDDVAPVVHRGKPRDHGRSPR